MLSARRANLEKISKIKLHYGKPKAAERKWQYVFTGTLPQERVSLGNKGAHAAPWVVQEILENYTLSEQKFVLLVKTAIVAKHEYEVMSKTNAACPGRIVKMVDFVPQTLMNSIGQLKINKLIGKHGVAWDGTSLVDKDNKLIKDGAPLAAIVMPKLWGDLDDWITKAGCNILTSCVETLIQRMQQSVTCLHRVGYAHHDLKLANWLVDGGFESCPNALLSDFDRSWDADHHGSDRFPKVLQKEKTETFPSLIASMRRQIQGRCPPEEKFDYSTFSSFGNMGFGGFNMVRPMGF